MNLIRRGTLFAICSGFLFGLLGYFGITIMKANLSVVEMLFWRFFISGIFIGLVLLPKLKTVQERGWDILKVFFLGAAFYSTASILYFIASKYIGTGLAMVIFFTFPTMVMVINWLFFREKIAKIYFVAIALITIGTILLVDISEFKFDVIGIGLGILSSILYAFYIIMSKKSSMSPLVSTFMVSTGCAATCLIASLMEGSFILPTTLNLWWNILGIGIICTAIPILLLLKALKTISPEKASILSVLEPVFVAIFGVLLLGERISLLQALGIMTILSGAVVTLLRSLSQSKKLSV